MSKENPVGLVFGIPELVYVIVDYCDLKSIGILAIVNKFIHAVIQNMSIYHQIKISCPERLWTFTFIEYLFVDACRHNALSLIKKLHRDHFGQIKKVLNNGFIEAASCGHLPVIKFLGNRISRIYMYEYNTWALNSAAENGHLGVIKFVATQQKITPYVSQEILCRACKGGHLDVVKFALEHGARIDLSHWQLICYEGQIQIINYFASLGLKYFEYWTLDQACDKGYYDVVKFLLDGREIDHFRLGNIFNLVCQKGHMSIVRYLISHVKDETQLYNGFLKACEKGHVDIVKFLVKMGVNIYTQSEIITKGCSYGHPKVIKFLTKKTNAKFVTETLKKICETDWRKIPVDIIRYLVDMGANIHVENDLPFRLACEKQSLEIVKFFVTVGAKINAENGDALSRAKQSARLFYHDIGNIIKKQERKEIIYFLLKCGAKETKPKKHHKCVVS